MEDFMTPLPGKAIAFGFHIPKVIRHARAWLGHPTVVVLTRRRGWPGQGPAMTSERLWPAAAAAVHAWLLICSSAAAVQQKRRLPRHESLASRRGLLPVRRIAIACIRRTDLRHILLGRLARSGRKPRRRCARRSRCRQMPRAPLPWRTARDSRSPTRRRLCAARGSHGRGNLSRRFHRPSAKGHRDDGDHRSHRHEQHGEAADQQGLGALTMRIRVSVHRRAPLD
jgi:hypothetical protein